MGTTGRGAGDQWVKSGDWELRDHLIEFCCFDSKLKWVKVCSKFDWRYAGADLGFSEGGG